MRIVISGGTGLIGRRLVEASVAEGNELVVLSRNPDKYRGIFGDAVELVGWDARTAKGWSQAVDGADVFLNLSGESISGPRFIPDRWTDDKKRAILESRVQAGQAIVEAFGTLKQRPSLLLQASAIGYYGPSGDNEIRETAQPGNDFLAKVQVASEAATAPVEGMGVRRIVLRTGLALTMAGGPLPRLVLPSRLFVGGRLGSGRQWYSWIHIRDLVRAFRFLMAHEQATGPINVVAPNPVTNREFNRTLGHVLGRPNLVPVPAFAMRLALGEVAKLVLEGQRVVPTRLVELGFDFDFPDLESALRDLLD